MYSPLTPPPPQPPLLPHHHIPSLLSSTTITRRSLLLSTSLSTLSPPRPTLDTTITDRVFLDFSICSNYFRPDRTLSDTFSTLCTDSTPLGRLVLGLYGHLVPLTVSNFKTMCTSYSYKNTLVHKIFPGQFFLAGRQGRREKGEVKVPQDLARNIESVDSKAFKLTHSGPGILSLCLSENDDEDDIKLNPEYRNVEFLITTGPGPCPQLDYKNIVFGVVLEVCSTLLVQSGVAQLPLLPQVPGLPPIPLPLIPALPPNSRATFSSFTTPDSRPTFSSRSAPGSRATFSSFTTPDSRATFSSRSAPGSRATFSSFTTPDSRPTFSSRSAPDSEAASNSSTTPNSWNSCKRNSMLDISSQCTRMCRGNHTSP
ncbi:peptidyl-prolyl cis-trans isomerase CYP28, chloroplastic isoform X1 [Populus nigra]|uniref:peptidyl-prolyl cis-trans isomerase CYP28, chloroplastic isoform X1 n=1 Tax=Populus nigra TaxID=3691 RepID=UPI002B26F166|nr:peptidyl-prolyl cis-trans isomerase CYP28, chloroplastic isoform X1 [Populus nigra]